MESVNLIFFQPQKIRSTISSITSVALENIQEPLKDFVWEFDKVWFSNLLIDALHCTECIKYLIHLLQNFAQGDFHHWIDLFNHFDSFFEKFIKPRKDLQVEDNFLEADPPFPRDAVLQILRVTRIISENCTNKHFYSSYEVCFVFSFYSLSSQTHYSNSVDFFLNL